MWKKEHSARKSKYFEQGVRTSVAGRQLRTRGEECSIVKKIKPRKTISSQGRGTLQGFSFLIYLWKRDCSVGTEPGVQGVEGSVRVMSILGVH